MSVVALARVLRTEFERMQQITETGLLNGVKDKDEYWLLVGRRQGVMQARAILDEEAQRFDAQD